MVGIIKELTINELISKKNELKDNILNLIYEFERETKVNVINANIYIVNNIVPYKEIYFKIDTGI